MIKKIFITFFIILPVHTMNHNSNKKERPLLCPYGGAFGVVPYSSAYIASRGLGLSLTSEDIKELDKLDQEEYGNYTSNDYRGKYVKHQILTFYQDFTNTYNDYEQKKRRQKNKNKRKERRLLNQSKVLNSFEENLKIFKNDKKN